MTERGYPTRPTQTVPLAESPQPRESLRNRVKQVRELFHRKPVSEEVLRAQKNQAVYARMQQVLNQEDLHIDEKGRLSFPNLDLEAKSLDRDPKTAVYGEVYSLYYSVSPSLRGEFKNFIDKALPTEEERNRPYGEPAPRAHNGRYRKESEENEPKLRETAPQEAKQPPTEPEKHTHQGYLRSDNVFILPGCTSVGFVDEDFFNNREPQLELE